MKTADEKLGGVESSIFLCFHLQVQWHVQWAGKKCQSWGVVFGGELLKCLDQTVLSISLKTGKLFNKVWLEYKHSKRAGPPTIRGNTLGLSISSFGSNRTMPQDPPFRVSKRCLVIHWELF